MPYFAYGSNIDPAQMATRCPGHTLLGRAVLLEHALCFPRRSPVRGCGTAGIVAAAGEAVWGVLYMLTPADEAALDGFEGCFGARPDAPSRHSRKIISVRRRGMDGIPEQAWTYDAVLDGCGAPRPSPDYIAHLLRGALAHGFPDDYVARLRAIETGPA